MKRLLYFFLLSIYFAAVATIISKKVYFGLVVFGVFFLISFLFICPLAKEAEKANRKKHEAFHFTNRFIISLTITSSFDQAYEDASLEAKSELKDVLKSVSHLSVIEKVEYLALYFDDDLYGVFVSVVKVFQEQGGNLLDIASPLLDEAAKNEEKRNSIETHKKQSIIQFSSMWFLSSLILCFLRYGLSSFYEILSDSVPFLMTSAAYFAIAIISFCIYAKTYCHEAKPKKKEAKPQ